MPELEKNQSAFGVDGIDDSPPALDLLFRIDARVPGLPRPVAITGEASAMIRRPAWRAGGNIRRSGPGARSSIVPPASGQGRHHDPMLEPVGTDLQR